MKLMNSTAFRLNATLASVVLTVGIAVFTTKSQFPLLLLLGLICFGIGIAATFSRDTWIMDVGSKLYDNDPNSSVVIFAFTYPADRIIAIVEWGAFFIGLLLSFVFLVSITG